VRCVVVDTRLEELDPPAYRFLIEFARDNELKLRPGRKQKRPEDAAGTTAGDPPATSAP
jgi:hypothetical protein